MDIITYIIMKQKMKKQSKGGSITNATVASMPNNNGVNTVTTVEKEEG